MLKQKRYLSSDLIGAETNLSISSYLSNLSLIDPFPLNLMKTPSHSNSHSYDTWPISFTKATIFIRLAMLSNESVTESSGSSDSILMQSDLMNARILDSAFAEIFRPFGPTSIAAESMILTSPFSMASKSLIEKTLSFTCAINLKIS